jgi:hypothetical protein
MEMKHLRRRPHGIPYEYKDLTPDRVIHVWLIIPSTEGRNRRSPLKDKRVNIIEYLEVSTGLSLRPHIEVEDLAFANSIFTPRSDNDFFVDFNFEAIEKEIGPGEGGRRAWRLKQLKKEEEREKARLEPKKEPLKMRSPNDGVIAREACA